MKKILCDDQLALAQVKGCLDPIHAAHYFGEVIKMFEERKISKWTLTPSDAEKLRALISRIKVSL